MTDEKSMLIAYDGSAEAQRALEYAAHYLSCEKAYIITVWEPLHRQTVNSAGGPAAMVQVNWGDVTPDDDDPAYTEALEVAKGGADFAKNLGFVVEPFLVESSTTVWSAIVDAANELDADIIVSGTRGTTGLRGLLQSSVADAVLKHAGRPVFIVPPKK